MSNNCMFSFYVNDKNAMFLKAQNELHVNIPA